MKEDHYLLEGATLNFWNVASYI